MDALEMAIQELVLNGDIKAKELAERLVMSHQVLLNKVNPHCEFNKLSVNELVAIIKATGDRSVYEAMGAVIGHHEQGPEPIMDTVLDINCKLGEMLQTLQEALEDNRLTEREKVAILSNYTGLIQSLGVFKASVAKH